MQIQSESRSVLAALEKQLHPATLPVILLYP